MRAVLAAVTGLVALAALARAGEASAFCRSTTCRGDCPTDENGCPSTGKKLFWPGSCVGFALQKNGTQSLDLEDVRVTLQKAFQAWTDVPCAGGAGKASMTFTEQQDVACKKSQYNPKGPNVNVVVFKDDDWTYHGIDGTLAKTSVTYDDTTGEIFDADIEVNAAFNDVTVSDTKIAYDLQAILTHEAGHFIGMAHSPDPNASMYASYAQGTLGPRKLDDDDVAGVCAIYPPGRTAVCDPTPRGGFSATCDDASAKSCAVAHDAAAGGEIGVAAGLGVLALAWRRRRRRDVAE